MALDSATFGFLDGSAVSGRLAVFSPAALRLTVAELDGVQGEHMVRTQELAYVAFHRAPEDDPGLPRLHDGKDLKVHAVGPKTFRVRARLLDIHGRWGFTAYPLAAGSPYERIFFYPHGVYAKEDLEPLGKLIQRDEGVAVERGRRHPPTGAEVVADGALAGGASCQRRRGRTAAWRPRSPATPAQASQGLVTASARRAALEEQVPLRQAAAKARAEAREREERASEEERRQTRLQVVLEALAEQSAEPEPTAEVASHGADPEELQDHAEAESVAPAAEGAELDSALLQMLGDGPAAPTEVAAAPSVIAELAVTELPVAEAPREEDTPRGAHPELVTEEASAGLDDGDAMDWPAFGSEELELLLTPDALGTLAPPLEQAAVEELSPAAEPPAAEGPPATALTLAPAVEATSEEVRDEVVTFDEPRGAELEDLAAEAPAVETFSAEAPSAEAPLAEAPSAEASSVEEGEGGEESTTPFLGKVLVGQGLVTAADVEQALEIQRAQPERRIGEILVELGLISEVQLYQALAAKFHMPFIDLDETPINPHAVAQIDPEIRARYGVLPVDSDSKSLLVVMSDPLANEVYDVLRFHVRKQVVEALATPTQIAEYLERHGVEGADSAVIEEILGAEGGDPGIAMVEPEEEEFDSDALGDSDNAVIRLANRLIIDAHKQGASDIHIEPYGARRKTSIRMRVDGECIPYHAIPARFWRPLVARLKIMAKLDIAETRMPQDGKIRFRYDGRRVELRVATLPTVNGNEDMVLRILASSEPIPLEKMGMSPTNYERFLAAIHQPYGLILCVGPTGSGKTTTLHSSLGVINTPDKKIWTAEDPVEITQDGLRQVQVSGKIGYSFAVALRAFLRADPDVVMVGEMRDEETARTAIQASLTGHMVFSTLHTNSAPETITRLLDMGINPFTFADALVAVLAQRLCRRLCDKCATAHQASLEEFNQVAGLYGREALAERLQISEPSQLVLWRGEGCRHCSNNGYRGRTALHELLVVDDEIKAAIERSAPVAEVRDVAIAGGLVTLLQDGIEKAIDGKTDLKQVLGVCSR